MNKPLAAFALVAAAVAGVGAAGILREGRLAIPAGAFSPETSTASSVALGPGGVVALESGTVVPAATAAVPSVAAPTEASPSVVSGRTVDPQGKPVVSARVTVSFACYEKDGPALGNRFESARRASREPLERQLERFHAEFTSLTVVELGSGLSAADGSFRIPLAALDYAVPELTVSAAFEPTADDVSVGHEYVHGARGPVNVGDVKIEPCRRFSVLVTADGVPVPEASVYFSFPMGEQDLATVEATSDGAGIAWFRDAFGWGGTQTVTAVKVGYGLETREIRTDGPLPFRIELGPAAAIQGAVLDASGAGVAGVLVSAFPEASSVGTDTPRDDANAARRKEGVIWDDPLRATTDAAGRFELGGLRKGRRYRIEAWPPDRELLGAVAMPVAPASNVELRFEKPVAIAVVVPADPPDEHPETRLFLVRRTEGGAWLPTDADARSEEEGEPPRFSGLAPGVYRVLAIRPGCAPAISAPVDAGHGDARVSLRFEPGRTVKGRILGADGDPESSTTIYLRVEGAKLELPETTDGDGNFELHELPPGAVELEAQRRFTLADERAVVAVAVGQADVGVVTLVVQGER